MITDSIVIDASVAAKWFLKDELEDDVDQAEYLLQALSEGVVELHAPQIFRYEICGLLTRACLTRHPQGGRTRLGKQDAIDSIHDIFDLPIEIHDITTDECVEALDMAVDYHKTHADIVYVQLARRLDCQWCTADEKFFRVMPADFLSRHVMPLSALR